MPLLPSIFIATTAIISAFTSAEPPVPVCCMGYAHVDETTLYIYGGLDSNRSAASQFVALNLTAPFWDTSSPPWFNPLVLQQFVPPTSSYHSTVAAKDRRNLFVWDPLQPHLWWWTYSIGDKVWVSSFVPFNVTRQPGVRLGVDLTLGDIYLSAGIDNGTKMMKIIPGINGAILTLMPTNLMSVSIIHESFVWSIYRNSFLHYGGRTIVGNTSNPYLNELLPTNEWVPVKTTGISPGDVSGHCMAPAYGGQSMIVFGGAGLDGIAKADIYILDLATSTWTTGKPADASQARTNMACAVSGDSFIAWGGESNNVNKDAVPIIYDIRNNEWTTQFKRYTGADAVVVPNIAQSTNSTTAIGGGMAGAVVVVAIMRFLLYRRRIASRKEMHNDRNESAIGLSLRDPQNPDGDPMTELLGVLLPSSSASPTNPLWMYYDSEDFFRRLAASPLAGPHSLMREPQGEQQHRSTSGDEDEFARPNNGSPDQDPSSLISPRSPHMVNRATATLSDWPRADDDRDSSDEHDGNKSVQQPSPPPSPRNPQMEIIDGQDGPPRAPQWQRSLPPVVFLDQSQYLERNQELAWMMEAIKAEKEVLDRRKLVQDALVAQMQATYPVSPSPSSDPHK